MTLSILNVFPFLYVLWQAQYTFGDIPINNSDFLFSYHDIWLLSALQTISRHVTVGFTAPPWLKMIQAVFHSQLSIHKPQDYAWTTHTLLKNVLDCASCCKPHYVSAECEVSGAGWVPAWCCGCLDVGVGVKNILYE